MGIIVARFWKKKTRYEVLDALESQIQSIEECGRNIEQTQKKMVGFVVVIFVCVYLVSILIYCFYFFSASLFERIVYTIPLILLPFLLLYYIKGNLVLYYNVILMRNDMKLVSLKDEKKKLLDDVMDNETYKDAKKILEKFAPEQVGKNSLQSTPVKDTVYTYL